MMKDGEFAIYLGKEYSAGEIEKGKIVLRSTDIEDVKMVLNHVNRLILDMLKTK